MQPYSKAFPLCLTRHNWSKMKCCIPGWVSPLKGTYTQHYTLHFTTLLLIYLLLIITYYRCLSFSYYNLLKFIIIIIIVINAATYLNLFLFSTYLYLLCLAALWLLRNQAQELYFCVLTI